MKRTLFVRIFAGYLAIVLILAVSIPLVSFRLIREDHIKSTQADLLNLGLAVQDSLLPLIGTPARLESQVESLAERLNKRITVIGLNGNVLADSGREAESMENHRNRPEVAAALAGRPGFSTRFSTTLDQDMLYVAQPLVQNGHSQGAIRLSCELAGINELLERIKLQILKLSLAMTLLALLASLVFAGLIARPVHALSRAARQVAAGDFQARVASSAPGEVGELCTSFNHMTERLEQSFADLTSTKQTLESIIAAIPDALLVIDEQGRIRLINASARRLTGTEPRERYYWEVLRAPEFGQVLGEVQPGSREIQLEDKTYLMSLAAVGASSSRVILLTDITELKRVELIKRDLVVNVSHELRTPLTAIKGFTETMLESASFDSEYLEIIARHTERLINIVGDLMNLSELENGRQILDLAPVELGALLASLHKTFEAKAASKGLKLELTPAQTPLTVMADAFRLEQLFVNLIDNAIKYTDRGQVSIDIAANYVRISDTGPGIAPEHLSRIFERFYVVDKSRSRQLGGTGLGLAIAKHIASLHGAELNVASRLGQGTSFTLCFRA